MKTHTINVQNKKAQYKHGKNKSLGVEDTLDNTPPLDIKLIFVYNFRKKRKRKKKKSGSRVLSEVLLSWLLLVTLTAGNSRDL